VKPKVKKSMTWSTHFPSLLDLYLIQAREEKWLAQATFGTQMTSSNVRLSDESGVFSGFRPEP